MNDFTRCTACDVRLKHGECYMCFSCSADHSLTYAWYLAQERLRLLILLRRATCAR